jgi:ribonucleoside-diphosphate reductase beta chain
MKPLFSSSSCKPDYTLFPLSYEWAWPLYKEMLANFWLPEEVPMGNDVLQWKTGKLSEAEQHLFTSVFSQLTTFDLLRTVDINKVLLTKLHAPELVILATTQSFQETVHTLSYQHVIETLGLDQNDIYTRYKRIDALANRVKLTEGFESLDLDDPSNLIRVLIHGFLMFENTWFIANLHGPIQNLARRNLMTGTAQQFQLIGRDEWTHVRFGIRLINEMRKAYPEALNDNTQEAIIHDCQEALSLEDKFIEYALPAPVLGYSAEEHKKLARFYAEKALRNVGLTLGIDPVNPFPWMDEMLGHKKEASFFEVRNTEYRVGGLSWEEEQDEGHWPGDFLSNMQSQGWSEEK